MQRKTIGLAVACALALGAAAAHAQTIVINQLDDMPLGTWSGIGDLTQTMNHCVGPTLARFRVTATGTGAGGAFTLTNGLSALPYTVEYAGRTGGFAVLSPGVPLTNLTGDTLAQCLTMTAQSERVRVTITSANLAAATAGGYSGTLTLVVAPE